MRQKEKNVRESTPKEKRASVRGNILPKGRRNKRRYPILYRQKVPGRKIPCKHRFSADCAIQNNKDFGRFGAKQGARLCKLDLHGHRGRAEQGREIP